MQLVAGNIHLAKTFGAMCRVWLTIRNKWVLDSIALDGSALYAVHTLENISIQSCYIIHSSDCHSVFCAVLERVHCQPREGWGKEFTTLCCCPIVYPGWVSENSIMSTDEGEHVGTLSPLNFQGDSETWKSNKHNAVNSCNFAYACLDLPTQDSIRHLYR